MPWDFWLVFLVLGLVIPWRGRARLKRLLSEPPGGTKEKLTLYGATLAFQWIFSGVVAWRALARGLTATDLGLERLRQVDLLFAGLAGAALLAGFQWLNLRRLGRTSGPTRDLMSKLAERLLPRQAVEFAPYCALAITAGVCEEFLYRGFAMAALYRAGIASWAVVTISSVLFGLAHAYQGRGGIVGTMLLGFVFAWARLTFASLLPVMIWHTGVDLAAGVAGPRYLVSRSVVPAQETQ
jgi:membrane protease YdiL (CAAX protease family)